MLTWFRSKRKIFAPAVATIFLGSLFSLYCPHCLALMEQEMDIISIGSTDAVHCSHVGTSEQKPVESVSPCKGMHDCENQSMVIGEKNLNAVKESQGRIDIRHPVLIESQRLDFAAIRLPYTIGKPDKPDRACYPPLERICVLLN